MSEQLLSLSNVYLTSLASLFEKTQLMLQQRLLLINKISEITNEQQEKKLTLDIYYKNILEPMFESYKQLEKDIINNQQLYEKIFNTSGAINIQLDNEFKLIRETQEQEIQKQELLELQKLQEEQEFKELQKSQEQDQEKLEQEIRDFRENEMREFEKEQERLRLLEREKERLLEKNKEENKEENKNKEKNKQNVHVKFKNNIKDDIYNSSLLNNIQEEHIEKVIKKQEILERVREKEIKDIKEKEIKVKEIKATQVKAIQEKEKIKVLRSTHIKILGFDKQNYNLSKIYIEYNYQNYPIVEFFNTCCTFYMGGTCNSPTCSLVHICIFCLKINYKNGNNLNSSCCTDCFPKNLPRCQDKIECVLASRCPRDHHLKEKFSFLLNETRDSTRTKMCYNSHSNKLKCKYAHSSKELLCYVCRENHMNSNECVNMPSFKSFANPYLYLCALKRVKTI
jgi:hypothetical protein